MPRSTASRGAAPYRRGGPPTQPLPRPLPSQGRPYPGKPAALPSPPAPERRHAARALRAFSGVLAGGTIALAAGLGVLQWLAGSRDFPGPGGDVVAGHLTAAVAVVALQWVADRRRGAPGVLAAFGVLLVVALLLWFGWWR